MAILKEMKCSSESTESLTSRLKVFISSSVYMTIDPDTSSVVDSSSCLVELLLAILVVASERGFLCLSKNFSSF